MPLEDIVRAMFFTPHQLRRCEQGFTLVEMMVALFIFAILSVSGVLLLRSAVDSSEVTAENLGRMADMQRFVSLIEADLSQTVPRSYRNSNGERTAAFKSGSGGINDPLLEFTRGGNSNVNEAQRSSLQRVEYRIVGGELQRFSYAATDGGAISEAAILLVNLSDVTVRFREKRGLWTNRWESERLADLPRAVEIGFELDGRQIRHMFLVGAGYL